ncbi:MAG: hypothetical protein ACFFDN_05835 [Candidatus Hodarchaeota archaeon]
MTAVKNVYTLIKIIALLYGLSVFGLSFMIGYDASQLSFPPISLPNPELYEDPESYYNQSNPEQYYMMSNNGIIYKFIVPTVIIVHNGSFGKDMQVLIPELEDFPVPIILPPKSSMIFIVRPPTNISNPLFQFIVMPQVWLGGMKIMEFQINTFTFPTFPIFRLEANVTG